MSLSQQIDVRSASDDRVGSGVPLRGILIGAVLAFLLSYLDTYALLFLQGSLMTLNFSAAAALFFLFFAVLAGGLLRSIHRTFGLTQAELITVYLMLLVACCIPGFGLTLWLTQTLVGSTYYASPENNWDFLYNQHIPPFLIPQGEDTVKHFFEGLPPNVPIPWEAWMGPLSFWYGFFLILCFVMICSMVILRKQWMDNEKLLYPLVQVPMQMVQQERGGIVGGPFLRNRVMWVGFALTFLLLSLGGLNHYFPGTPYLVRSSSFAMFDNAIVVPIQFNPSWIGFFFFVNRDISASIWVFYLLATVQRLLFGAVGLKANVPVDVYSGDPYTAHQCMGAMIVFVLVGLWTGRGHLRDVLDKALGSDNAVDDTPEMMSYRQAAAGLVVGLALLATGLWVTGLSLPMALMFTFGAMVLYVTLTRAVAEGGVPAMRPAILTASFLTSGAGTTALGTRGLVALGLTYGWHAELRTFVMAAVANGLRLVLRRISQRNYHEGCSGRQRASSTRRDGLWDSTQR